MLCSPSLLGKPLNLLLSDLDVDKRIESRTCLARSEARPEQVGKDAMTDLDELLANLPKATQLDKAQILKVKALKLKLKIMV